MTRLTTAIRSAAAGLLVVLVLAWPLPGRAQSAAQLERQLQTGPDQPHSARDAEDLALLARFYRERQLALLWSVSGAGVSDRGRALAAALRSADRDGLDPDDYGAAAIDALLGATRGDYLAELELRLSLGLIRMTSDLASGRLRPNLVDPELFLHPKEIDRGQVIRAAAGAENIAAFVAGFAPSQDEYRRLKRALATLRAQAAAGQGWGTVPAGPTLEPGMTDPRVAALRARLRRSSDPGEAARAAQAGGAPDYYDDHLVAAVERFQKRHGLEVDGKVGVKTVEALNVPIEARIRQMVLNLERRRWMADDAGARYVFVNLADFALKVVDGGRTVYDTRVVVGAPFHRTPVFSADMTYVEINPYWNVPPSIARAEMLPKIQADPGYLAKGNFELLSGWSEGARAVDPWSVDWSAVSADGFRFKLRQGPGPGNALGRIKFMLPNPFDVYLHDTPARALFAKSERSFSHGCIRVEAPNDFGAVILGKQDGWSLDAIERAIASGERRVITLKTPVPVHITYLTAWVNRDGAVHFRNDVYGRDAILAEALFGPRAHGG